MSKPHKVVFSARKILLPIDFSPSSEAALEAATGLALQFHASVHLVHIIPEIPDFNGSDFFPETTVLQERKEVIQDKLEARKEELMNQGLAASFSIETGNDIVGSLMRVIDRENTDMAVISTHGMSGWHPLIFGSIAEQVIKRADCTLLLLHSGHHEGNAEEPAKKAVDESFVPVVAEALHAEPTFTKAETLAQKRLDRAAEESAERGGRTEEDYDQAHPLFSK